MSREEMMGIAILYYDMTTNTYTEREERGSTLTSRAVVQSSVDKVVAIDAEGVGAPRTLIASTRGNIGGNV